MFFLGLLDGSEYQAIMWVYWVYGLGFRSDVGVGAFGGVRILSNNVALSPPKVTMVIVMAKYPQAVTRNDSGPYVTFGMIGT